MFCLLPTNPRLPPSRSGALPPPSLLLHAQAPCSEDSSLRIVFLQRPVAAAVRGFLNNLSLREDLTECQGEREPLFEDGMHRATESFDDFHLRSPSCACRAAEKSGVLLRVLRPPHKASRCASTSVTGKPQTTDPCGKKKERNGDGHRLTCHSVVLYFGRTSRRFCALSPIKVGSTGGQRPPGVGIMRAFLPGLRSAPGILCASAVVQESRDAMAG